MQEIEAKFYVKDFKQIELRLRELKAQLIQPHTKEINIRYDTPARQLAKERRVLRLRKDHEARLTYKGAGKKANGIASREEIEFVVQDFKLAQKLLESLGYEQTVTYEKKRAIYELGRTHIMLDNMPYGHFVEIEGSSERTITSAAIKLGLKRDAAISASYLALFERVCAAKKLKFRDLSFKNFKGISVSENDLQIDRAL